MLNGTIDVWSNYIALGIFIFFVLSFVVWDVVKMWNEGLKPFASVYLIVFEESYPLQNATRRNSRLYNVWGKLTCDKVKRIELDIKRRTDGMYKTVRTVKVVKTEKLRVRWGWFRETF